MVNNGNYCLAKPGEIYAVYLPCGGNVQPGQYVAAWWNPTTGGEDRSSLRQRHDIFMEFAAGEGKQ